MRTRDESRFAGNRSAVGKIARRGRCWRRSGGGRWSRRSERINDRLLDIALGGGRRRWGGELGGGRRGGTVAETVRSPVEAGGVGICVFACGEHKHCGRCAEHDQRRFFHKPELGSHGSPAGSNQIWRDGRSRLGREKQGFFGISIRRPGKQSLPPVLCQHRAPDFPPSTHSAQTMIFTDR